MNIDQICMTEVGALVPNAHRFVSLMKTAQFFRSGRYDAALSAVGRITDDVR